MPSQGQPFGSASDNPVIPNQPSPTVAITFGTVNTTDESAAFIAPIAGLGLTTDYEVRAHFEIDKYIVGMPVTSPGGFNGNQVAACRLAVDTLYLVVEWTAECRGSEPQLPNPEPSDANYILAAEYHQSSMLRMMPDGQTAIYRTSGVYSYICLNPTAANLWHPRPPWMSPRIPADITPAAFVNGVIFTAASGGPDATPDQ